LISPLLNCREEELAHAAIAIQSAFRTYKERKAYQKLYESRRWTLHKEGKVLTDHVTKSRVGGRPGRRPPTRGKRVVGLEKPTAEPTRVMPNFSVDADDSNPDARNGATRSAKPRPLSTSMFGGPGGIQFDPSKVQLRSSPGPVEKTSHSVNSSPIARLKNPPRPLSMTVEPTSPKGDSSLSAESRERLLSQSVGLSPMPNAPPPKPVAPTKQAKINPALFVTDTTTQEESSPPDTPAPSTPPPSSPAGPPPMSQVEQKRKTRVGRILTTFLSKRPARSTLVENGILQADELADAQCPPSTNTSVPDDPIARRPALIPSKVCNDPRCKKKIKGKKGAHCLRCGRLFCKSTCLLFKTDMPELGYMEEVFICATCFQVRITEGHARSKD